MENIKKSFPWAVPPSEDEFSQMWQNAIFVFDTNFLLDLYRVSNSTRQDYLKILEKVKDRIWIPKSVADEFFTNRENVIASNKNISSKALSKLKKINNHIETLIKEFVSQEDDAVQLFDNTYIKEVKTTLVKIKTNSESKIEEITTSNEYSEEKDSILESIDWLFSESKIGKPFKEEDLQKLYEKAEKRFKMRIPPGFKDNEKPGVKQYGDFIIWQQILNFAKETSKPIIFITNDKKEDWWNKDGKNIIAPRIELRREFDEYTEQRFWMYRTERFLKFAEEHLNVEVDENSINETQEIAEEETWENESDSDSDFESGSKRTNIVEQLEFVIRSLNRDQNDNSILDIIQNAEKTLREDEKRQKHWYENL